MAQTAVDTDTHDLEIVDGNPWDKLHPQLTDMPRIDHAYRPVFFVLVKDRYGNQIWIGLLVDGLRNVRVSHHSDDKAVHWIIYGEVVGKESTRKGNPENRASESLARFIGRYNTRRRNGWLDAEDRSQPLLFGAWNMPNTVSASESGAPFCFRCSIYMVSAGSCHVCIRCGNTSGCS